MKKIILVAGATGNLGKRIVKALLQKEVEVRVVVRESSDLEKINTLEKLGATIHKINNWKIREVFKMSGKRYWRRKKEKKKIHLT